HFQIGLWDDRVFVWLAYIYELPNKKDMANIFIDHFDELNDMIPKDYDISMNHMKKSKELMQDIDLEKTLKRFRDVKSAELLIGKQFGIEDNILKDGKLFVSEIKSIYDVLIP